ncbi:MAG: hypothetical protein GYB68_04640, partial [Chloroflexi bacterium]|nr:hypothetical protein [Chloroflexota bacterium]
LLGTLGVLLTYALVRRQFGWPAAAIAALALAVSFWSLMYSRSGQRHISLTVTTLASFYFLWQAIPITGSWQHHVRGEGGSSAPNILNDPNTHHYALAGVFMGLGFYTYFASRGVPLILIAWMVYLAIWQRDLLKEIWQGLLLTLLTTVVLAVPLFLTLAHQPEAEARVSELALPIYDALDGDWSTIASYSLTTLGMFTHTGDSEVLYNITERPVFGFVGGIVFWGGVLLGLIKSFGPDRDSRYAFLLLWLGAGLAPGVLSVPAASLGHNILALPVVMILPAIAISEAGGWLTRYQRNEQASDSSFQGPIAPSTVLILALTFLVWEGVRGPYDYFRVWPDDGFTRVLHHSDLHEAAEWLNQNSSPQPVAIGGFLTERWDQEAFRLSLEDDDWKIRAFDPEHAVLTFSEPGLIVIPAFKRLGYAETVYSTGASGQTLVGVDPNSFTILQIDHRSLAASDAPVSFANGLDLTGHEVERSDETLVAMTCWQVEDNLSLPPFPLLSKPPAPDEDGSPRLAIFLQVIDPSGFRVAGWDGLGVDPYSLEVGDQFCQRSIVDIAGLPTGAYQVIVGLYNPVTGQRHLVRTTNEDHIKLYEFQLE